MKSFNELVTGVMKGDGTPRLPKPVPETNPNPLFEAINQHLVLPSEPVSEGFPVVPKNVDEHVASKHHTEVNKRLQALQDHIKAVHEYVQNGITPTSREHADHLDNLLMSLKHVDLHVTDATRHLSRANKSLTE